MSPRTLPAPPAPDERGTHEERPYWLWRSRRPGRRPAMLILHGSGSAKENHADFGRLCAAAGWVALGYDQRGHGESGDEMGPAALGDVGRMAAFLARRDDVDEGRVCVRGSSMGGFWAIQAAATTAGIAGAIAICPAGAGHLLQALRDGRLEFRAGERARAELAAWLEEHDLADAARQMGAKPLIVLHARGDEQIPSDHSEEVCAAKPEPRKLVVVPGGHHRSVQHDAELQSVALSWLQRRLG